FERKGDIKRLLINFFTNPIYIISLIVILGLTVSIAYPLLKIVVETFQWSARDFVPGAVPGDFTFHHWISTIVGDISGSLLYEPMLNTLGIGALFSVFALSLCAVFVIFISFPVQCQEISHFIIGYQPSFVIYLDPYYTNLC